MNDDSTITRDAYDDGDAADASSTMNARDDAYGGRALVAAFSDRMTAHQAAHQLHDEGFRHVWIGVTQPSDTAGNGGAAGTAGSGTTTVRTDDGDSILDRIGRFFSGETGDKTLYDELVRHGVAETAARRIDGSLAPNSAILTVDGSNHPELAAQLIEQSGGHVLAGESFGDSSVGTVNDELDTATAGSAVTGASRATEDLDAADDSAGIRGSQLLGYGDSGTYARGQQIDESRRLQLREERLSIDKQRQPAGEAQIGKEVVEHRQDVDVPVVREELFVERRPVAQTADMDASDGGEIAEGETIRIPLMREQVAVTKRPVVTGEVVIGKRQVTESEHVSETTREERLRVDSGTGANGNGNGMRANDGADVANGV